MILSDKIAGRTLLEWQEFAKCDDCLDQMVPSDLRQLIGAISQNAGWVVSNSTGIKHRCWKDGMLEWTFKIDEATRYARREDAEAIHSDDDDVWMIKPYLEIINNV
jgi:hypothetical protein